MNNENYTQELLILIRSNIKEQELKEKLSDYHENDIADVLPYLSREERQKLYRVIGLERTAEVFTYLEDFYKYFKELNINQFAKIIENMDSDEATRILDELDDVTVKRIAKLIDEDVREDIRLIRSYDEEEIGSKLTTNFIVVDKEMTIKEAMKSLVQQAEENDNISTIYVEDKDGKYYGAIDLKDLIVARAEDELEKLVITSYPYVLDHEKIADCIDRILDYEEDSIPVLNSKEEIIGIITSQDLIEVVDDEMGDDYVKLAGLTAEEDLNEPLIDSLKKRLPWLIVLLFLGMIVSSVVGLFEGVVSQIAIVVCFQSLILDMSGNVGTQSLAVTIRVLVDEELSTAKKVKLVFKEMRVGLTNGLLLGSLATIFLGLYIMISKGATFGYAFAISGCVGISLLGAMIISSFTGTIIPMFFHRINVDPAVASGPLITTVNDLVAVVTYYGLAWLFLINILHLT